MLLMRMKMGHTGVSDIESKEPGKPLKHEKKTPRTLYSLRLHVLFQIVSMYSSSSKYPISVLLIV